MSDHTTQESTNEIKLCECGCGRVAPISPYTDPKKGYIKGHPRRFVHGHHNRIRPQRPVEERFWSQVNRSDHNGCWLWMGAKGRHGHGQFFVGSKKDKSRRRVPAHRFSYELRYGPISQGVEVCHNCPGKDNPSCVNPDHLFSGSHLDNMRDMVRKGRNTPGIRNAQAKLTEDDVRQIRQLCADGALHREVAEQFGVSKSNISFIVRRERWNHVE